MVAPPAWLVLSDCPEGICVEMPNGGTCVALDPRQRLFVQLAGMPLAPGEPPPYAVRVCTFPPDGSRSDGRRLAKLHALGWGGRRSFSVFFDAERGWTVDHAGHMQPILLDGREYFGRDPLADGTRIEPARGLVLTFTFAEPPA